MLPPSSCQSVEAVPEEKYGLLKQNNLFLPQNTISVFWRQASSPDSLFLCLQWRSLPCHDDLGIWHCCVTDHRVYHVEWLACAGNAKPTRWQIIWVSDDLWGWLIIEPSLLTSLWPNTKPNRWQIIWVKTTFEGDSAVFGNRSRHFQLAQFLPASLAHEYLSHNSHDYASCDSHEYLSHKMRQTATNWSWPLSCVHATSSISIQSTFGLFGSKTSTVLRALFWRRPPVAIRYLGREYKHLPREYISTYILSSDKKTGQTCQV